MAIDITTLVDPNCSFVSRRLFNDRDIYDEEMQQVFGRAWLFLGHESQVAKPKDFFTAYMGEEPILVTRDTQGQVHAFLNTCRHRGMRVCRADAGSAAAFTCSYHAWTYATDGSLIGVPALKEAYHDELDKSEWGLIPVPRLESYKGLLFGNFDAGACSLVEYLGDMAYYMDLVLDRREGGTEVVCGIQKWIMDTNWKVIADNHTGDFYHVPYTHASAGKVLGGRLGQSRTPKSEAFQVNPEPGHGLLLHLLNEGESQGWGGDPLIDEYMRATSAEAVARLGAVGARTNFTAGLVFPNLGWVPSLFTLRVFHPRGPERMEIWSYILMDRAAPPEVKDAIRRGSIRRMGATGMFEQDDGENWTQCSASSRSSLARNLTFHHAMGLGHDRRFHEELPGHVATGVSEQNQRSFYGRWASMMDPSWTAWAEANRAGMTPASAGATPGKGVEANV